MKKKKAAVIGAITAVLLAAGAFALVLHGKSIVFEKVYVFPANNGSWLYYSERGDVVRMTDLTRGQKLFQGLIDGDHCIVAHDGVQETYPAGTGVYFCWRLSHTADAIPETVRDELRELGWLTDDAAGTAQTPADAGKEASLESAGYRMSVLIPGSWQFAEDPSAAGTVPSAEDADVRPFALTVTPDGGGSFTLTCYPTGGFAVCGTGLTTKPFAGGAGKVGYYDSEPLWSYTVINDGETQFVALNNGLSAVDAETALKCIEAGVYSVPA
ncbi:MAG: hypothetical protein IJJ85_04870 [Clostridia bacterium]|nr:hypothetical protein [Clostridia bacterium]